MKNLLFKIFCYCFIFLSSNNIHSQSNIWETHFINDKIKIEYSLITCEFSSTASQELVVFRFTNLTDNSIKLSYSTKLWNKENMVNTEHNHVETRKYIELGPNEIKESNCDIINKDYTIFSSFIHNETKVKYETLIKFELTNINIKL